MINGIQKYLMIALSAVFLCLPSNPLSAQELEKIILPMQEVILDYKGPFTLLTVSHTTKLDITIHHMHRKPKMKIVVRHCISKDHQQTVEKRVKFVKAYIKDNGINVDRVLFLQDKKIACRTCYGGSLHISEQAE